ncbi:acetylglutamate kinase [Anaerovorax sp. IOR16]|uniref:acetylglutamate kinase n=1 Tax=Anaerovorax sp. IOR16 TaxID=2773458 RepID=UPI001FD6D41F|nr:acetylglutamate kinase [Anaerovorax sp. IOR16]
MYNQNNNFINRYITLRQFRLFNVLRRLWMEHVMWTRSFIISTASDLDDLEAVTKRLLRNPDDFAKLLRPLYGDKKSMEFKDLFTDHLLIAANLVNAAKAGDTKTVDEQRKKWYENADDIANLLGNMNPYWNKRIWKELLDQHLKMTENEAVQILTGQYEASIDQYDEIEKQALQMADEMAYGIINQFQI